jgi:hypothetical protein
VQSFQYTMTLHRQLCNRRIEMAKGGYRDNGVRDYAAKQLASSLSSAQADIR